MTTYDKYKVVWDWMKKDERWVGNMPVGFKVPHWFDFNKTKSSGLLGQCFIDNRHYNRLKVTNYEILWINLVYNEIIKLDDNKG